MTYIPKTKEWFIERQGKRIFRDFNSCSCHHCSETLKDGLVIMSEQHAHYLAMVDYDYASGGTYCNYRDIR